MFLTLPLQHALMRLLTGLLPTHHHTEQQAKQTGEYDDSNQMIAIMNRPFVTFRYDKPPAI